MKMSQKVQELRDRGAYLQFDKNKQQDAAGSTEGKIDPRFGNYCIGFDAGYSVAFITKDLEIAKLQEAIGGFSKALSVAHDTIVDLIKLHEKYVTEDPQVCKQMVKLRTESIFKQLEIARRYGEMDVNLNNKISDDSVIQVASLLMGVER